MGIPDILAQRDGQKFKPMHDVQLFRNESKFSRRNWNDRIQSLAGNSGQVHHEVTIAVASHGGVIKRTCGIKKTPNNNAVVEKLLVLQVHRGGTRMALHQQDGCEEVIRAPSRKDLSSIERKDVANCNADVLGFDYRRAFQFAAPSQGRSECERLAESKGAYPTKPAAHLIVSA